MGGGDKTLLRLDGQTLLGHVLGRVARPGDAVALSANGDVSRFDAFDLPVLADAAPDASLGPLAGVLAAMDWASRLGRRWLLSVPGDCPFVPPDLVDRLLAAQTRSQASVVCASSFGRLHHATALWQVALAAPLQQALAVGVRRIQDFTSAHRVAKLDFAAQAPDPFLNLNTPAELAAAEALLAAARR